MAALAFLAIAGVVLVVVLGRPDTVSFAASFKCERLSLGSRLDLGFSDVDRLVFRAGSFRIPRDYAKDLLDADAKNSQNQTADVEVSVSGNTPITADVDSVDERPTGGSVTLDPDSSIELQPSSEPSKFGEFRVVSEKVGFWVGGTGVTLTTPFDPGFNGFYNPATQYYIGSIAMDGSYNSQGGVADSVSVSVPETSGPVRIRGSKDEISDWNPISVHTGPSEKPLELAAGRFWAEKISSGALSVNGEPVDMATAVDRLQIDIVKASVTRLALHQDNSEGYIAVAVSGVARSIRQNNKEVIESVISRLLSQPSYKTGFAGLCLVFVVFAGGIFLKRALDVLAETWLPKS